MDRRSVHSGKPPLPATQSSGGHQGIATLVVMVAVLVIIVLFCCFAAPGIRGLCKRYIFRSCAIDDPDLDNVSGLPEETSPTIILLPFGRMLVVDQRVLSPFHSHGDENARTGMELLELSAGLIRSPQDLSTPSVFDSGDISKEMSLASLTPPPPQYEEVFPDLPPSYSQLSLMIRNSVPRETLAVDGNMNEFTGEVVTETPENDNNDDNNNGESDGGQNRTNNNV